MGVSIINLLVPPGLWFACLWAAQGNFSHLMGVLVSAKQLKDIVRCILEGELGPCPKAALSFFRFFTAPPLSLHTVPSPTSNCLNLPVGTQGRETEVSLFPVMKKWGTQKGF